MFVLPYIHELELNARSSVNAEHMLNILPLSLKHRDER